MRFFLIDQRGHLKIIEESSGLIIKKINQHTNKFMIDSANNIIRNDNYLLSYFGSDGSVKKHIEIKFLDFLGFQFEIQKIAFKQLIFPFRIEWTSKLTRQQKVY